MSQNTWPSQSSSSLMNGGGKSATSRLAGLQVVLSEHRGAFGLSVWILLHTDQTRGWSLSLENGVVLLLRGQCGLKCPTPEGPKHSNIWPRFHPEKWFKNCYLSSETPQDSLLLTGLLLIVERIPVLGWSCFSVFQETRCIALDASIFWWCVCLPDCTLDATDPVSCSVFLSYTHHLLTSLWSRYGLPHEEGPLSSDAFFPLPQCYTVSNDLPET